MTEKLDGLSEADRALFEQHLDQFTPPQKKTKSEGKKNLISAHRFAKLARRGSVKVEMTIDLHGKTVDRAWKTLDIAIDRAKINQKSVLRVITGKGLRSSGGTGVLIKEIPARLQQDPRVKEIVQAQKAKDGGSGAWFVRI